jgi:hypothetical protein
VEKGEDDEDADDVDGEYTKSYITFPLYSFREVI